MRNLDVAAIKHSLANRVVEAVGLAPFDVVLVGPLRIPRTSSGKLQRTKCAQLYQEGAFDQERLDKKPLPVTAQWSARTALLAELKTTKDPDLVRQYLQELFRTRLHQPALELQPDDELATLGIDSVRAMELVNTLNQDLRISLEPTWVFTANTVGGLVATIEVALWVAEPQAAGQGILL
ncbi:phosphopantetheine-binding protein [Hymenobacter sp. CRA2]|uniref:phosphopantetheine-binding protein n=1 Tax=Hymenobacter sp. CRA2 TaxID=1955620 RepID=UPI003977621F